MKKEIIILKQFPKTPREVQEEIFWYNKNHDRIYGKMRGKIEAILRKKF